MSKLQRQVDAETRLDALLSGEDINILENYAGILFCYMHLVLLLLLSEMKYNRYKCAKKIAISASLMLTQVTTYQSP